MPRTVSCQCPQCGYVRYDLIDVSDGGLLIRDNYGRVSCRLCGSDFNRAMVVCGNCGYKRPVNLSKQYVRIVTLDIYETYIID